jgi:hypothetical protein
VTQGGGNKRLTIIADASYARFMEIGTYKIAARPFLRPAVYLYAKEFGPEVAKALGSKLSGSMFKGFGGLEKMAANRAGAYSFYRTNTPNIKR